MVIEFRPPIISNGEITQAAKMKVWFEYADGTQAFVTFGGFDGWELLGESGTKLNGTGSRNGRKPLDMGSLFLQSHWGSLVEFKNPIITELT